MAEQPSPVVTFADLAGRIDELCRVLECVSPSEAQCLACASRCCLQAVVAYVRDHGGLRRLWRAAWPESLTAYRSPSRRDWARTVVHASWALSEQVQHSFETSEQVCIDIDPPASVGEAGLVMAWRVAVEWRASAGRAPMHRYAVARAVVDARDGRLGVSHAQRVPCAHHLASATVDACGHTRVAGLMRLMGWLSHTRERLRLMVETRCDGSIFIKVAAHEATANKATTLPHVRILPSSDLRAVFWIYSRALTLATPRGDSAVADAGRTPPYAETSPSALPAASLS